MKRIYPVLRITLCALLIAAAYLPAGAQDMDEADVKALIEDRNFVFKAQMALPMGGNSRYLTSSYDMKVSEERVITYLPYFGRAYRAPSDLTGGGIDFESEDFDYAVKERRKGGWDVKITPNDAEDVRQMFLTVSENGSASLRVNSDRRQAISFNGYITEKEKSKSGE
ncbi:uncharacterized protein DUF4251 [Anseongella ginsenosidimutans]|uniref:Uncharacterized protein DUF4251 n=1 Tax=Anseongella ginsenosidimutans TaxID=496056 RepID=A0A4R3KUC0_9SPHI|nr:DUF4251 domain-containing protein [Anseongella ginsenosidimutans]QEC51652.1 DUF4251 domain-containing protein [Anseongella ginsenosidimutans]TCS88989.1 uncharacterized protein DUF4251 [Anseongella ginsenosidimutans]